MSAKHELRDRVGARQDAWRLEYQRALKELVWKSTPDPRIRPEHRDIHKGGK